MLNPEEEANITSKVTEQVTQDQFTVDKLKEYSERRTIQKANEIQAKELEGQLSQEADPEDNQPGLDELEKRLKDKDVVAQIMSEESS